MFKLWLKNLITFKLANADLYKNVAKRCQTQRLHVPCLNVQGFSIPSSEQTGWFETNNKRIVERLIPIINISEKAIFTVETEKEA
jgi:hypothetical protein